MMMAGQQNVDINSSSGSGGTQRDEIKTHFTTREGVYKLVTLAECSRLPNRAAYIGQSASAGGLTTGTSTVTGAGGGQQGSNPPVKVSFATLPSDPSGLCDRICFNYGRELYFYAYKGTRKPADLSKPIDKRIYKGTSPTCHDINRLTASGETISLLVGFTGGQIQLIDPVRKEVGKLFNEERIIEKTKVTCIKWLPGSPNLFLVSHASGHMYLYSEDATCGGPTPPTYQLFKQGSGFSVWTCKAKSTRNPLYRWVIGEGAINDFAFSPCAKYLAVASQDGCLRILNYDQMELVGLCTSYFGGLLCVCWSPDGQLVVAGGEDDLVTVWSFQQQRVVARGQGHRSWVTVVAFDPYTTTYSAASSQNSVNSKNSPPEGSEADLVGPTPSCCYRLGSVAMDTQLCLWELTDDVLKQPYISSSHHHNHTGTSTTRNRAPTAGKSGSPPSSLRLTHATPTVSNSSTPTSSTTGSLTHRLAHLNFSDRKSSERQKTGGGGKSAEVKSIPSTISLQCDPLRLIGTPSCPRLDEAPLLEPLVCKKVAQERLTALIFREDCVLTACQDGVVCTWARPTNPPLSTSSEGTMV